MKTAEEWGEYIFNEYSERILQRVSASQTFKEVIAVFAESAEKVQRDALEAAVSICDRALKGWGEPRYLGAAGLIRDAINDLIPPTIKEGDP